MYTLKMVWLKEKKKMTEKWNNTDSKWTTIAVSKTHSHLFYLRAYLLLCWNSDLVTPDPILIFFSMLSLKSAEIKQNMQSLHHRHSSTACMFTVYAKLYYIKSMIYTTTILSHLYAWPRSTQKSHNGFDRHIRKINSSKRVLKIYLSWQDFYIKFSTKL